MTPEELVRQWVADFRSEFPTITLIPNTALLRLEKVITVALADEREACAKIAEPHDGITYVREDGFDVRRRIAAAIRAQT